MEQATWKNLNWRCAGGSQLAASINSNLLDVRNPGVLEAVLSEIAVLRQALLGIRPFDMTSATDGSTSSAGVESFEPLDDSWLASLSSDEEMP